jgi:hypothetical protein
MNQSLFSKNEQFSFTKPSLVLYVEDTYNVDINTFIQTNYQQIVEYYSAKEIDFCYLPYLLQNKDYQTVVSYNRPYLHNAIDGISISEVYRKIKSKLSEPFDGAGLVLMDKVSDKSDFFSGFQLLHKKPLIEQFEEGISYFQTNIDEIILSKGDKTPMFKIIGKNNLSDLDFGVLHEQKINYSHEPAEQKISSNICYSIELNADNQFDYDAYRLADEIRTRIQLLKESGSLSLIGDILEEIQGATKKLSSVFITNDYRIFLKDYDMKEIVMPPLPKSLYILFLRHPEGILFKQLSNYHDELLSIYRNVTVHENIDRAIESIRAMTDPLNNSINEKCSRIRAAFLDVIADDLAQNYYVTGYRGEPKKIIIDRSLVEFQ